MQTTTTVVTQATLARYRTIENTIKELKGELGGMEDTILADLEAGASVEPGAHTARIKTGERRSVAWKNIVIRLKGEGYASNVLKNTKAKPYSTLEVK